MCQKAQRQSHLYTYHIYIPVHTLCSYFSIIGQSSTPCTMFYAGSMICNSTQYTSLHITYVEKMSRIQRGLASVGVKARCDALVQRCFSRHITPSVSGGSKSVSERNSEFSVGTHQFKGIDPKFVPKSRENGREREREGE